VTTQNEIQLKDNLLALMKEVDSFAAIDYLERQTDPLTIISLYNQLLKHYYYEVRDIQAVIMMARAGAQYGLTAARFYEAQDPATAKELKEGAKGVIYNLASYTWPGWKEPGIEIGPGEIAQGLDAAKASLRLAQELEMPPLRLSRSHWMVGVQLLASGKRSEARVRFEIAAQYADEAGQPAEVLLSKGFTLMTILLDSTDDQDSEAQYLQLKRDLAEMENGEYFIAQLDTAFEVFSS